MRNHQVNTPTNDQLRRSPIGFQIGGSGQDLTQDEHYVHEDTEGPKSIYFKSLVIAFEEFLQEESKGYIFTELRLVEKIKASRKLFDVYKNR